MSRHSEKTICQIKKRGLGRNQTSQYLELGLEASSSVQFSSIAQSCVQLFATPWTAAYQASLSITNSWNLLKLMCIELVMPSNHLMQMRSLQTCEKTSFCCLSHPAFGI